jgi:hypothetical protein
MPVVTLTQSGGGGTDDGVLGAVLRGRRVGRPRDGAPVSDSVVETDAFLAALRQLPPQQAAAIAP